MQCGHKRRFPWRKAVFLFTSLLLHYADQQSCVCVWKKCVFLFSSCQLHLVVSPAVGAPVLSESQQSVFCCWCWLSHVPPCEAFAGAHSSSSSRRRRRRKEICSVLSCSGQYWLFCGAVWVRLSDSPPPSPTCSITHWLPLSSSIAAGKTHALKADNTTVRHRMGFSLLSLTALLLMCLHKAWRCIVILYRCIRCLWTRLLNNPLVLQIATMHTHHTHTWLTEIHNRCSVNKQAVMMPFNHIYHRMGEVCCSGTISWLLNNIKVKTHQRCVFLHEWTIFSTGGRHGKCSWEVMQLDEINIISVTHAERWQLRFRCQMILMWPAHTAKSGLRWLQAL